ncbi:BEN domain-containing protein 5-like [Ixodes scapularis]
MAEASDSLHMTLRRGRSPLPRVILRKLRQPPRNPSAASKESTPSTAMSSRGTDAVGDGEMVPKELLRAKEEELKIVKAKLRKSEATCRRLTLALLDQMEITRDRTLQKPCCQAPLEGAVVAKSISLPSTSTAAPDSLLVEMREAPPHPSSAVVLPSSPGCSPSDGGMCSCILQFSTKLCTGRWLYGSTYKCI